MRKFSKRGLATVSVLVVLVASFIIGCAPKEEPGPITPPPPPPPVEKVLHIGHMADLTGAASSSGRIIAAGGIGYVRYANDVDYLKGIKIVVDVIDSHYDTPKCVSGYEELKSKGAICMTTEISPCAVATTETSNRDKMPVFSCSSPNSVFWPPKYYFITRPTYPDEYAFGLKFFMARWEEFRAEGKVPDRAPRCLFISPDHPYGRANFTSEVVAYAESIGWEWAPPKKLFVPISMTTATLQVNQASEWGVDYVFFHFINPLPTVFAKDATRMGKMWKEKVFPKPEGTFWFSAPTPDAFDQATLEYAGAETMENWYGGFGFRECSDPAMESMGKYFLQNYPGKSTHMCNSYGIGWVKTFLAIEAIKLALEDVPFEDLTPEDIAVHGLSKMGPDYPSHGMMGPVDFSGGNRAGVNSMYMVRYHEGKAEPMSDWEEAPHMPPTGFTWPPAGPY